MPDVIAAATAAAADSATADTSASAAATPVIASKIQTPSAEVVAQVADKVAKLTRDSQLALDINAGRIIINDFYGGSLDLWNQRNTGDKSLEALAKALEEKDATWTESRLYRAVRLFEQRTNLGDFAEWPKLMPTHFLTVQGLPWDRQQDLLTQANAEGWTTDKLQSAKGSRKPTEFPAAPVASAKDAMRMLKAIERGLALRDHLMADLSEAGLEAESAGLVQALEAARVEVEQMQKKLAEKVPSKGKKSATDVG
ncbi:MAG: hypothetical protein QM765_27200 [Myxococcales bacterium]